MARKDWIASDIRKNVSITDSLSRSTDHKVELQVIAKAMSKGIERLTPKEEKPKINLKKIPKDEYQHLIRDLTSQMDLASANLEFEKAAELRDLISEIKSKL